MKMKDVGLGRNQTDELGLWVLPMRRGSSEGLPTALTRPLEILQCYPFLDVS